MAAISAGLLKTASEASGACVPKLVLLSKKLSQKCNRAHQKLHFDTKFAKIAS